MRNNAALIANGAAGFHFPTLLTTVAEKSFSGPMFDEPDVGVPRRPGPCRLAAAPTDARSARTAIRRGTARRPRNLLLGSIVCQRPSTKRLKSTERKRSRRKSTKGEWHGQQGNAEAQSRGLSNRLRVAQHKPRPAIDSLFVHSP